MTDRPGEPTPDPTAQPGSPSPGDGEPEPGTDPATDRRDFLRHLSRDAVWTAGRVAGWSTVVRRSMVAAGEAATASLVPPDDPMATMDNDVQAAPAEPPSTVTPTPAGIPSVPASTEAPAPVAVAASDVVAKLTADQHAFLGGAPRITLALNDPAGAPQVTSSSYHWDGATFRLPGRQFTLRASNIERDPRVSLFIEDAATDSSVAITGDAAILHGDAVEAGMLQILARDGSGADPRARLDALRAEGDLILIEVRPIRFVWRAP